MTASDFGHVSILASTKAHRFSNFQPSIVTVLLITHRKEWQNWNIGMDSEAILFKIKLPIIAPFSF